MLGRRRVSAVLEVAGLGCVVCVWMMFSPTLRTVFQPRASTFRSLSLVHYGQTQGRGFSPTGSSLARTSLEKPAAGWRRTFPPRLTRWTPDSPSPPALPLVVLQDLPSLLFCPPRLSPGPTTAHLP